MAEEKAKKTAKSAGPEEAAKKETNKKGDKGKKRAKKRSLPTGNIYIQSSYNNTIVTITEENGDTVCWATSGSSGFKGSRKSTPYAAQITTENVLEKAKAMGMTRAHIYMKGPGSGRDQALRAIAQAGIEVESITETTPMAHNGCRKRRRRRV